MSEIAIRIIEVVGAGVFGGGLAFIGTLLKHKWEKQEKEDKVTRSIESLKEEQTKMNKSIELVKSSILDELAKDRADNEEYRIKLCRQRILQFNDELYRGVQHTKESFDDVISEGIDVYEDYCDRHTSFLNFKAEAAIDNIKDTYKRLLKDGGFLS
jgi:hypothetical protein